MVRLSKAARGKHRWVGVEVRPSIKNRKELEVILSKILEAEEWRLYDFHSSNDSNYFIIKISLEHYKSSLISLNSYDYFETLTSSGKIKLVRARSPSKV
jgi:hypothetical protein